jgi:hypothetical protein
MKQQKSVKPSADKGTKLFAEEPYQVRPRTAPKETGTLDILKEQEQRKLTISKSIWMIGEKKIKRETEKEQRGQLFGKAKISVNSATTLVQMMKE